MAEQIRCEDAFAHFLRKALGYVDLLRRQLFPLILSDRYHSGNSPVFENPFYSLPSSFPVPELRCSYSFTPLYPGSCPNEENRHSTEQGTAGLKHPIGCPKKPKKRDYRYTSALRTGDRKDLGDTKTSDQIR